MNATDEAKEQYNNTITNQSLSINSIKQKIQEIVDSQNDDVKDAFNKAKINAEQMEEELKDKLKATSSNLSDEAKPYFDEIQQVMENGDTPLNEIPLKIAEIASKIPTENIKSEIAKIIPIHIISQNQI